jgi:hypothetical protein
MKEPTTPIEKLPRFKDLFEIKNQDYFYNEYF